MARNFLDNLIHSDFDLTDFDFLVFDEVHTCQPPDHLFNQIMTDYYYNKGNYEQLPFIIGMAGFENVFKLNDSKISVLAKQMTYSNMLNSKWTVLNESQALDVMRMTNTKFQSESRFSSLNPFQMQSKITDKLTFMAKLKENVIVGEG